MFANGSPQQMQQINDNCHQNSLNLINQSVIVNNNIMYRNGHKDTSLPASPQSQQSLSGVSSPQGSPDPFSISPQDLNPFNNCEILQKQFDSFNLVISSFFFNSIVYILMVDFLFFQGC
jgi:hypothetical protein